MTIVYIGLGANLAEPIRQIQTAIFELEQLPQSSLTGCSSLYRTCPVGPQDQPDYINAVVRLETTLAAMALLQHMQALEIRHGRKRQEHWGPRTLDLDLLLYGEEQINEKALQVPHPEMVNRVFVLHPLLEIEPEIALPGLGSAQALLDKLDNNKIDKVAPGE